MNEPDALFDANAYGPATPRRQPTPPRPLMLNDGRWVLLAWPNRAPTTEAHLVSHRIEAGLSAGAVVTACRQRARAITLEPERHILACPRCLELADCTLQLTNERT